MKRFASIPTAVLAGVIGTVALAGTADAAVHYLVMGGSNTTTTTTTIYDKYGTPLYLKAPSTKAPLSVSNRVQVPNLNASYLGGISRAGYATKAQAQAMANSAASAAASKVQSHFQSVVAAFTNGGGAALCPTGMHPVGGGALPDMTGATAPPYLVVSSASTDPTTGQENGWLAAYSGGTSYDGKGFIWVSCTDSAWTSATAKTGS